MRKFNGKLFGWPGANSPASVAMADRLSSMLGVVTTTSNPGATSGSSSGTSLAPLPPPRPNVLKGLAEAGVGEVRTSDRERMRASVGASLRDGLRVGANAGSFEATDAVVYPRSEAEVLAALKWGSDARVCVVPYGGGTAVSGGLEPSEDDVAGLSGGRIAMHMGYMSKVLEVNEQDLTVTVQPGCLGPLLEEELRPYGLTARFFPQSFTESTVGGWVATRAAGHFATGPTHIDEMVQALRMATPTGVVATPLLPASGAGPDPKRLLLGSEGTLGVVTEVVLKIQKAPRSRAGATFDFPGFFSATAASRAVVQAGLLPANCRAVDEREAVVMGLGNGSDSVLLLAFESQLGGDEAGDEIVAAQLKAATRLIEANGGVLRTEQPSTERLQAAAASAVASAAKAFSDSTVDKEVAAAFEAACSEHGAAIYALPDGLEKLNFWALYKQATCGDAAGDRPSMLQFVKRAKYDAWSAKRGTSAEESMRQYTENANALGAKTKTTTHDANDGDGAAHPVNEGGTDGSNDVEGEASKESAASWKKNFITAPAARDDLMIRGLMAETFETAVTWSRLEELHEGIVAAVEGEAQALGLPVIVTCRITHVYADGCAPYFTVVVPQQFDDHGEMLEVWDKIKTAANAAIGVHGGTASHHHAVGRDHMPTFVAEVGDKYLDALRAVKAVWDPVGVCNPGVLVMPQNAAEDFEEAA
mmetsp:Transcript_61377/g.168508  ORF Transcript_61377/g.168508 Transcript_61377/m.168508 type:complete len:703 (-) Transcript_61377:41-2149(-)